MSDKSKFTNHQISSKDSSQKRLFENVLKWFFLVMTNKFTSSRSSESYWNLIFIAFTICYNLILLFFLMILTANDYCENENKNDFNKRRLSLILAWKIFDKES